MAGDWIKMRVGLHEDPAVISISQKLNMDVYAVIGRLHRLWSWATTQTKDGNARGVTGGYADELAEVTGFAQAMQNVGWLVVDEEGIRFPKFDRHMSQGGKNRALTALRVKRLRNAGSVTREEKSREEKKRITIKGKRVKRTGAFALVGGGRDD